MSPTLVVETADLAAASHTLSGRVGDRLWSSVGEAMRDATACTGMAGDDPAGLAWAQAYEQSAAVASTAAQDVINGAFTLAGLLAATAQNYARADAASTTGTKHAVDDVISHLDLPGTVTLPTRFEGVGGGAPNAPFGWSHVEHYVRLVWPNGHQDRLLRAAGAWHRSAAALSGGAEDVDLALIGPLLDGLPEWPEIRTACWALSAHLRTAAHAHRALARACEQFAHHLDVAHSKVGHEVRTFLLQSAAIEVGGNLLSVLTLGVAEEPTQDLEAARFTATVARIVRDLAEFANTVREIVASLPLIEALSERVGVAMRELLSARIIWAEVAGVPGLRVLSIARDGHTAAGAAEAGGELGAVTRLADDANLPTELRSALDSPRAGEWNEPGLLKSHFTRHGGDFGSTSDVEYESQARQFFRRGIDDHLEVKIDKSTGDIRIYDSTTNTFGSYTSNGTVRTFYKPTSSNYWEKQKGDAVRW